MSKKISEMSPLSPITGDEEIPLAYQGYNYKVRLKDLKKAVTKEDIGLGNVDNTSDLQKATEAGNPIKTALDDKASISHTHTIAGVVNLQATLDNKADVGHKHNMTDISNLTAEFNNYALAGHQHTSSSISDFATTVETVVNNLNLTVTMPTAEW